MPGLAVQKGFPQAKTYIAFRQTDASATHGQSVACSGAALTSDTGNDIAMSSGGTPGTTPRTITVAATSTEAAIFFESDAVGITKWHAGIWTININWGGDGQGSLVAEIHICCVNSSGVSQGTVASNTTPDDSIIEGVYSYYVTQQNDYDAAATDRVYIVIVLENPEVSPEDVTLTPNALIVSPIQTTQSVRSRSQRLGHSDFYFQANAYFIAPSVETVTTVAAPTFIAYASFPDGVNIYWLGDFGG